MHTAVRHYHICVRIICVDNKGKALVHPKGHYINTVCYFNRIERMKDRRSQSLEAGSCTSSAYLIGAPKLNPCNRTGPKDAQDGGGRRGNKRN